jgi:hypothetical protein
MNDWQHLGHKRYSLTIFDMGKTIVTFRSTTTRQLTGHLSLSPVPDSLPQPTPSEFDHETGGFDLDDMVLNGPDFACMNSSDVASQRNLLSQRGRVARQDYGYTHEGAHIDVWRHGPGKLCARCEAREV